MQSYDKRKEERDRALRILIDGPTHDAALAVSKALREQGATDDQIVAKLRSLFVKEPSLGDAIQKALANPSSSGDSAGANPLPVGASDWRPDFGAALEKAKSEPDRLAVVKETVRLAKGGVSDLEVERARQLRKDREARQERK